MRIASHAANESLRRRPDCVQYYIVHDGSLIGYQNTHHPQKSRPLHSHYLTSPRYKTPMCRDPCMPRLVSLVFLSSVVRRQQPVYTASGEANLLQQSPSHKAWRKLGLAHAARPYTSATSASHWSRWRRMCQWGNGMCTWKRILFAVLRVQVAFGNASRDFFFGL